MSKLAAAISCTLNGEKRAADNLKLKYTDVNVKTSRIPTAIGIDLGILVSVKLEKKAWIADHQFHSEEQVREVMVDIKRAMIEEVFGEFRPIILEMRAALYDEDKTRLRQLLAELENQMFVDGV